MPIGVPVGSQREITRSTLAISLCKTRGEGCDVSPLCWIHGLLSLEIGFYGAIFNTFVAEWCFIRDVVGKPVFYPFFHGMIIAIKDEICHDKRTRPFDSAVRKRVR